MTEGDDSASGQTIISDGELEEAVVDEGIPGVGAHTAEFEGAAALLGPGASFSDFVGDGVVVDQSARAR